MYNRRELLHRVLFVCTGSACRKAGCRKVIKGIAKRAQHAHFAPVRVVETRCLGHCGQGPNVIAFPEGCLYHGVRKSDVALLIGPAPDLPPTAPDPEEPPHQST